MCTNFTPTRQTEWAAQALGVSWPQGHPEEVFPGQLAPIVLRSHRQERHAAGLARFGLIPTWAKDLGQGRHTYNARSETAAAKPSFRHAWQARQYALLVVDRFYEPCYETGRAVRWSIAADNNGTPLGLACLWERWVEPETRANRLTQRAHGAIRIDVELLGRRAIGCQGRRRGPMGRFVRRELMDLRSALCSTLAGHVGFNRHNA